VNFRRKVQRVEHRSKPGPRVSQVRKVFPVRQVFRGRLVERAHPGRRVCQAPPVIRTLLDPRNHPGRPAHPVRRDPLGLPVLHGSRDFPATMAQ